MQVSDSAQPFRTEGGEVGVLFCHGFTGSPWSLREWAQVTADSGYRVSLPLLPGHGTDWRELNLTGWQDWYAAVEREFLELRRRCDVVFLAGLSMGGALALRIAERYPEEVAGLSLVNPAVLGYPKTLAIPLLSRFRATAKAIGSDIALPGVREEAYSQTPLRAASSMLQLWLDVRAGLDLVHCPLQIFRSAEDHVVPAGSTAFILSHVSSEEISETLLRRSYHVATMDYDRELIFRDSLAFFQRHSAKFDQSPGVRR